MAGKKGDLEVCIIEARGLEIKGQPLYCSVELLAQRNTANARTYYTTLSKDGKWNQTINLDLYDLYTEELLVKIYWKRNVKKDKFLGQSQTKILALDLSKEAQWYKLTDMPDELKTPETLKRQQETATGNLVKKKDLYIISGEIQIKLTFVHRLIRARSKTPINSNTPPDPSSQPEEKQLVLEKLEIEERKELLPEQKNMNSRRSKSPIPPRKYLDFSPATLTKPSEPQTVSTEGEDKTQLEQLNKNLSEQEKILESTQEYTPETQYIHSTALILLLGTESFVDLIVYLFLLLFYCFLTCISDDSTQEPGHEQSRSTPLANSHPTSKSLKRENMHSPSRPLKLEEPSATRPNSTSHTSSINTPSSSLAPVQKPRPLTHTLSSEVIKPPTNFSPLIINRLQANAPVRAPIKTVNEAMEFANIAEEVKYLRVKVKFLEKNMDTLQSSNHQLEREVTRLEKDLERERLERKREREDLLLSWEKGYNAGSKLFSNAAHTINMEENAIHTKNEDSPNITADANNDALVTKLESKLDNTNVEDVQDKEVSPA